MRLDINYEFLLGNWYMGAPIRCLHLGCPMSMHSRCLPYYFFLLLMYAHMCNSHWYLLISAPIVNESLCELPSLDSLTAYCLLLLVIAEVMQSILFLTAATAISIIRMKCFLKQNTLSTELSWQLDSSLRHVAT